MATSCMIGRVLEDGRIRSTVCEYDGHLSSVGKKLQQFWNTPEKIDELHSFGRIRTLGEMIGQASPNKIYFDILGAQSENGWTIFTIRDIEDSLDHKVGNKLEIFYSENEDDYISQSSQHINRVTSYTYLFKDGQWYVALNSTFWTDEVITYTLLDRAYDGFFVRGGTIYRRDNDQFALSLNCEQRGGEGPTWKEFREELEEQGATNIPNWPNLFQVDLRVATYVRLKYSTFRIHEPENT